MVSDNAKAFKAIAKALKRIMSHADVQCHLSGLGIEWSFNLEKAPWWGGILNRWLSPQSAALEKL